MRKGLKIGGAVFAGVILIVIALVAYAVLNLNRIIAGNREYVLARVSDSLGRRVEVQDVKAAVGFGVAVDITGLKVADDPAFEQLPIVEVSEVDGEAEFIPLLFGRLHLRRLVFRAPRIRMIRDANGRLNLSELGKKGAKQERKEPPAKTDDPPADPPQGSEMTQAAPKPSRGSDLLRKFAIKDFAVRDGLVSYRDLAGGGQPLTANAIDLDVHHFSASRSFQVAAKLAALGKEQNLSVSGEVGPLMHNGALDVAAIPLDLKVSVGPLSMDRVRTLPMIGPKIPAALKISDSVSLDGRASGSLSALRFAMRTDLSSPQVAYGKALDKPAGVPFKVSLSGTRQQTLTIEQAALTLGALDLKAKDLSFGGDTVGAQVDTNRFELAGLAKSLPALAGYSPAGTAEVHAAFKVMLARSGGGRGEEEGDPSGPRLVEARGTIALAGVALQPKGGGTAAVSNLNSTIRLNGTSAVIEPTSFDLGSGHATLQAQVPSFDPLKGDFRFGADKLVLAELVPSRKAETPEQVRQLAVKGTFAGSIGSPEVDAQATSPSGSVANVDYQNLALDAAYGNSELALRSLKLNAFSGAIAGSGAATLSEPRPFDVQLNLDSIDLEQALQSQKAKAAGIVRGALSGRVRISGRGAKFDQIKPTLQGAGQAAIRNGKLVGVNVVAQALKQARGIPGLGDLVTPQVIARHPELFASPDTDIRQAGLTFTIAGPRITSHDLTVQSADYRLLGDGSFDMDKNIDMTARIILSKGLSDDLEASKKEVVYLTNNNGEVEIPLRVVGTLPKPKVLPDIQAMAQQAAKRALQKQAGKFLGGVLGGGKKGAPPINPLSPFEKFLPH